jgi:stage II sporulation protein D
LQIDGTDERFAFGKVTVTPCKEEGIFTLPNLKRSQESPSYSGSLILEKTEEGLCLVNELTLEDYLCKVVPSEMPSAYPLEALKAQAVCARTYALKRIAENEAREECPDLDDSVSFQVYNNFAATDRTDQAVEETRGQVLMKEGELLDALYYSTSCGLQLSEDLADEAVFCTLLSQTSESAYEKEEAWYRWDTSFSLETLTDLAEKWQGSSIGNVLSMDVVSRGENGQVEELKVTGEKGALDISGEYYVRTFLNGGTVTLQDETVAPDLGMLPSAFFYLEEWTKRGTLYGYQVIGGGYGHGKGMSQNGAKHMAYAGKTCQEILKYYYL